MWLTLIENPKAVETLYATAPSLKRVWLQKVYLDANGPTITLHIHLLELPTSSPAKWHRHEHNRIAFQMALLGATMDKMSGWTTANVVTLNFSRTDDQIEVAISGDGIEAELRCGWIRVQNFSPYLTDVSLGDCAQPALKGISKLKHSLGNPYELFHSSDDRNFYESTDEKVVVVNLALIGRKV